MKTFKDLLNEVAEPKGGDEKRFKDKHITAKMDHPSAEEDQFVAKTKKKKREADLEDGEDEDLYESHFEVGDEASKKAKTMADKEGNRGVPGKIERLAEEEMSDAEMKKRENIVKSMKDNKAEFQKRYGDKWKSVMYATATKQAMKESADLNEMRQPFVVIDTADRNKVVATASDERGAQQAINSAERPPMSIKDKSTLKIVKSRKKQDIGYPLKEEVELNEDVIADLKNIVKKKSAKDVKFSDGNTLRVDMQTANILLKIHDSLNSKNQQTFANAVNKDETGFMKMVDFAHSKVK